MLLIETSKGMLCVLSAFRTKRFTAAEKLRPRLLNSSSALSLRPFSILSVTLVVSIMQMPLLSTSPYALALGDNGDAGTVECDCILLSKNGGEKLACPNYRAQAMHCKAYSVHYTCFSFRQMHLALRQHGLGHGRHADAGATDHQHHNVANGNGRRPPILNDHELTVPNVRLGKALDEHGAMQPASCHVTPLTRFVS